MEEVEQSSQSVFENCYISSFSDVAKTKTLLEKLLKLIIFFCGLIGFLYQFTNFIIFYLLYTTITTVTVTEPETYEMPAVTVCNRNTQRRSFLCNKYDKREIPDFCSFNPWMCSDYGRPIKKICTLDDDVSEITKRQWWPAEEASHTSNIIRSCYKTSGNFTKPCNKPYVKVPALYKKGSDVRPSFCYIIHSALKNTKYKSKQVERNFKLVLNLAVEPEEYETSLMMPSIYVFIHDAKKNMNAYDEGKCLKAGYKYRAQITNVVERIAMPSPYDTNCKDYEANWKNNNGSGPLSEQACLEHCFLQFFIKRKECIPSHIMYPHTLKLCNRLWEEPEPVVTSFLRNKCSKECTIPCFERKYTVDFENTGIFTCNSRATSQPVQSGFGAQKTYQPRASSKPVSDWCKVANISLEIIFEENRIQLTKIANEAEIQTFAFFSNVGGYVGLWIGLSVIHIFDFLVCLCQFLYYSLFTEKKTYFKDSQANITTNHPVKSVKNNESNTHMTRMTEVTANDESIFNKSYISSVADIASSKTILRILSKLLVFVLCLNGFVWNLITFLDVYWSYQTVRSEITTKPMVFERPAITICDSTVRFRSVVCEKNRDECIFPEPNKLCKEYPQYCMATNEVPIYTGIYKGDSVCPADCLSWEMIRFYNEKMPVEYPIYDENVASSRNYPEAVPFTTHNGEPTLCYTYGTQLGNESEENGILYISSWNSIEAYIPVRSDLHLNPMENASIYFSIHDGKRRVNPFKEGIKLRSQRNYHVFITEMIEQIRLPAPYETNCTDYLKMWNENDRTGPLTTMECIEYCLFTDFLRKKQCVPRSLGISHTEQLCREDVKIPQKLINYCVDQCGPPCLERIYKYDIVPTDMEISPVFFKMDEVDPFSYQYLYYSLFNLWITLTFRRYHHTKVVFEPKYREMDLFSNIGGYLGIWIGVSAVSFLDLLYLMCTVLVNKKHINSKRDKKVEQKETECNINDQR